MAASAALGEVDIRIGKELPPGPVSVGDTFIYQLIVSNAGTKPVTNVVVVDARELLADAPNGRLELLSVRTDQGSCQLLATDRLRCELGTLHLTRRHRSG